jgi:DnaJ-class molecular chaperone
MKTESDKELADKVDARKRLEKHGYRRVTCEKCRGTGGIEHHCFSCGGKGYRWEAPAIC